TNDDFKSPLVRGMRKTTAEGRARHRILTDDELCALWKTTGSMPGPFPALVRFLLLTGARRNEARGLRRSEISADHVWTLPVVRNKVKTMKDARELKRPLSAAALAVLAGVPKHGDSDLVFTVSGSKPINDFHRDKTNLDEASGVTGWRLHDLRRTARSLM